MDQHHNDGASDTSPSSSQSGARSKRRSLLPQPGAPKATIRSVALPEPTMDRANSSQPTMSAGEAPKPATSIPLARGNSVTGSRLGRLRPRSTYQAGTPIAEKSTEAEKPAVSQSMRPPSLLSKPTAISSAGGLGRTQSLRRPAAATQFGPPASVGSHSRTQSTSTVPLARSNTTRPRTTAERPKSMHISSSTITPASTSSTRPEPAIARASTRLAGLSRSASVKTKPDVSSSASQPRAAPKPEQSASVPQRVMAPPPRPKEPAKEESKKAARPAFSTLQQHFTPRKTGKAPTSTFLHPAPVATSNALPPELVSLQIELLQLHLLHENAAEVSKQWEESAKRTLRSKFDEVSSTYQVMLEHERSSQEQKNLQALLEWTGGKASGSLVEHIQVLSGPLHELPSLVQAGGRIQRHVAAFEQWVSWVGEVRAARRDRAEEGVESIEGLGDTWKAENAALMRKLTSFARDLSGLAEPAIGSSIAAIITCCGDLLDGLLKELRVMQTIETDVVKMEQEWVETRLQGIAADIGLFLADETPAWRM